MANASPSLLLRGPHCSEMPPPLEARHSRLRSSFEVNNSSTLAFSQPEVHPVSDVTRQEHNLRSETISFSRPLRCFLSSLNEIVENCLNLLAESHVSLDKVHQVSVMATLLHISLHQLAHFLPQAQPEVILHWMVPVFASIACLSGVIMLWMKCYPSQLVVVCAITTLFAVECLLPFAIAGCTILCIGNFVSLADLICISGCLLGLCSITSWGIRQVLYPTLGLE